MVASERMAFRPKEVGQVIGTSDDLVHKLIASGELRSFKIGAARFVSADELRSFIARREAGQA